MLQRIHMKLLVLCAWAERAILGSAKTHDLTFYFTHNQVCMPQYKVNVRVCTWDTYITLAALKN